MRRTSLFLTAIAAGLMPLSASAFLLDDGNLSLADSGAQTSNSDWSLVVNFPDGSDDAAQFQTGFANAQNTGAGGTEAPGTGTGIWFKSFEGNQSPGDLLAQATLSQAVVAPFSGDYKLNFVAGRETNFTAAEFFVELASSGTGGTATIDLLTASIPNGNLGGAASANAGGTPFSLALVGVTAGDTLTVTAAMVDGQDAGINPQSAFIDSFELIPEPTSALIALAGLLGVAARRR